MLPQRLADSGRLHRTGAVLQRVAARGADPGQIAVADGLLLRLAVGVDRAAHRVIPSERLRRRDTDAGHRHHEPAVRAGRQGLHQVAHAAHAAGAAQQCKRHVRADARTDGTQFAHGQVRTVQLIQADEHAGGVGTAARHARPHRGIFIDGDVHARQKAGVVKKGQRCLDGSVFVIGGHQTARQTQVQVGAAAQHHPLVEGDGLHGHVQIMIAARQKAHHVQRQIELCGGQNGHAVQPCHLFLLRCRDRCRFPAGIPGCA